MAAAALTSVRTGLARTRVAAAAWWDRLRGVERLHYIHIGKTGGTALKAALRAVDEPRRRFLLHQHQVSLDDIRIGEPCLFFVRDPISRFTSGFLSRQRQGKPRHNVPWSPEEEKAFTLFQTPNALALTLGDGDESRRAAAERAMREIRHVRDSYWRWLKSEDYLRSRRSDIVFVGAQEHLERDVATLARMLDMSIILPSDDVNAHRSPGGVPRRLEAEAVANLRQWYADDYRCLAVLRGWFPHLPDYGRG